MAPGSRKGGRFAVSLANASTANVRRLRESGTMPRSTRTPELLGTASVGFGRLSNDGRFLAADEGLRQIVGYAEHELRIKTIDAITHESDRDADAQGLARLRAGAIAAYHADKQIVRPNGQTKRVSQIIWRSEGSDFGVQVIEREKDDEEEADEREAEDAQRVMATLQSIGEAVIAASADGRVTHMNAAAETMTGFDAHEALGQALDDIVKIMDEAEGTQIHDPMELSKSHSRVARRDLTVVARDRKRRPVWATCAPILHEDGTQSGVVLVLRDRSEEERAMASFRALIEALPELILVHHHGEITYANPAVVRTLAYGSATEIVGRAITDLLHPEDRELAARPVLEGHADPPIPLRWVRSGGGEVATETLAMTAELEGEASVVVLARDVTERNEIQERLLRNDRMAALGTLAAGVAHEINNPLTYLLVNLEHVQRRLRALAASDNPLAELESETAPNVLQSYVQALTHAVDGANRVRQIVRDLMTFSQGNVEHKGLVDVRGVVESSIQMSWHEIRHRARLVKHLAEVPPVEASEARLGQVFLNLLVNAAQAIPEGQAHENEVRVSTREDDRGNVVIEIADTGRGIPREMLPRIFDPFFTTKEAGGGLGLGLSISHGTIKSLGGELRVESAPGRGSVFRVCLPAAKAYRGRSHGGSTPDVRKPAPRKRVLVVDDEPLVSMAIARVIEDENDVEVVNDAAEALSRIVSSGKHYDVVLCDLMMPVMTGMDLYAEIVRQRPHMAGRIIFMTGGAFTTRARAFLESVGNPCLEKPLDMAKLRSLISKTNESAVRG